MARVTPACVYGVNPSLTTRTSYVPIGRSDSRNVPKESVWAVRVRFVSGSRIVTVAPVTTAPLESWTVPSTTAVCRWAANARPCAASTHAATASRQIHARPRISLVISVSSLEMFATCTAARRRARPWALRTRHTCAVRAETNARESDAQDGWRTDCRRGSEKGGYFTWCLEWYPDASGR